MPSPRYSGPKTPAAPTGLYLYCKVQCVNFDLHLSKNTKVKVSHSFFAPHSLKAREIFTFLCLKKIPVDHEETEIQKRTLQCTLLYLFGYKMGFSPL